MNFLKLPLYTIIANIFLIVAWVNTPEAAATDSGSLFSGILFVGVILNIVAVIGDNIRLENVR